MPSCYRCGESIEPGDNFCANCGEPQTDEGERRLEAYVRRRSGSGTGAERPDDGTERPDDGAERPGDGAPDLRRADRTDGSVTGESDASARIESTEDLDGTARSDDRTTGRSRDDPRDARRDVRSGEGAVGRDAAELVPEGIVRPAGYAIGFLTITIGLATVLEVGGIMLVVAGLLVLPPVSDRLLTRGDSPPDERHLLGLFVVLVAIGAAAIAVV